MSGLAHDAAHDATHNVTRGASRIVDITVEPRVLGPGGKTLERVLLASGILGLGVAWGLAGDARRFLFAYLLNYAYVLSIVLGSLFFVLIQHVTRAGWSVVVRRIAEAVIGVFPLLAALSVPILCGAHALFPWAHAEIMAENPALMHKASYLNLPFFVARLGIYFAAWILIAEWFRRASMAQDADGNKSLTLSMQSRSAASLIIFGFTLTFASIDLVLSLDPHWFSSIFGVYYFAGAVMSAMAFLIVCGLILQKNGFLRHTITREHYHDLGKLLFAFICFWAYIAFSQYMLYWYANIPEETGWFFRRMQNGWGAVGVFLIVGHFILPFVLLLSRHVKRHRRLLGAMAAWALFVHWVDFCWLILPEFGVSGAFPGLVDLAVGVGIGGLTAAFALFRMRNRSWVPERDPRLMESINFENA